jgi:hypothetical protein
MAKVINSLARLGLACSASADTILGIAVFPLRFTRDYSSMIYVLKSLNLLIICQK